MNKWKYTFLAISIGVITSIYYLNKPKNDISDLVENSLLPKKFPSTVKEAVISKTFEETEYLNSIKSLKLNSEKHLKIGKDLYSLAFTNAMYSKEKLRLLIMSKHHLLMAKEMEK